MLRRLLQRLLSSSSPRTGPEPDSREAISPYLKRGENESAEQHAVRLRETEVLLSHWANCQNDWRNGVRTREGSPDVPVWDGESLQNKTVLVHDWPGLGDSLNFVRFVPDLKSLGATTIIEARPEAASLLSRVEGVDEVVGIGSTASHDFHVPSSTLLLNSLLPALQEASIAGGAAPYLSADPAAIQRWEPRLSQLAHPRIGLSWAGNPTNRNDAIRSVALQSLAPLFEDRRASFVSLQVGAASDQARTMGDSIVDLGNDLHDLEDTGAVITHLDLVISIDSTVAHLAGGMGKPIWLLRSAGADRRWDLVSNASHWYPGLRVYSTEQPGVWADTISKVAVDLARFGH